MSVLIKGLKMPTSCLKGGCPVDGVFCQLWEDKYWASYEDPEKGRHRDCPLIELPDHGDLIDRDNLVQMWKNDIIEDRRAGITEFTFNNREHIYNEFIDDVERFCKVVIPAERSE